MFLVQRQEYHQTRGDSPDNLIFFLFIGKFFSFQIFLFFVLFSFKFASTEVKFKKALKVQF